MGNKFFDSLQKRWDAGARVRIGLDSDPKKLPNELRHATGYGAVGFFNMEIIETTKDSIGALVAKPKPIIDMSA